MGEHHPKVLGHLESPKKKYDKNQTMAEEYGHSAMTAVF